MGVDELIKLSNYRKTWVYDQLCEVRKYIPNYGLDSDGFTNLTVYEALAFMRMVIVYNETKDIKQAIAELILVLGRFEKVKNN